MEPISSPRGLFTTTRWPRAQASGEADAACPFVKGAAARVSMPYLDPKIYDGGAYETAKYAERRDDMGRLMLSVMMQARRHIAAAGGQAERTR